MANKWWVYWRIASSLAGLAKGNFFVRGLPAPTVAPYAGFTAKVPQNKGGLTRQGYRNITLQWSELTGLQLETLTTLVEAGITAGALNLTIDRADGTGVQNDFIDVHGVPHPLTYSQITGARGAVFQNVELVLMAIVIDNDPAVF